MILGDFERTKTMKISTALQKNASVHHAQSLENVLLWLGTLFTRWTLNFTRNTTKTEERSARRRPVGGAQPDSVMEIPRSGAG